FLAILGHDLRAPLQAVSMSAELLARKIAQVEKTHPYISRIQMSTRHMGAMVSDLLEFVRSRLGAGLPVERKYMDLAHACREAIEEACAGHPGAVPVLEVEGDTKGHWDAARMGQLLQNLIGNAMQHGAAAHEIRLRVSGNQNTVELIVHNEGKPIAEDAIGTIFDPLVRSTHEDSDTRNTTTSLG
ncbi:HAMP domain-containing sensor histidine kinase, partial [Pseudomonas syringae pv. actinidiae]|nr:HAMP domain-containing sensor histidine kinase [Pseudomonas syringae pv. actinidiae]